MVSRSTVRCCFSPDGHYVLSGSEDGKDATVYFTLGLIIVLNLLQEHRQAEVLVYNDVFPGFRQGVATWVFEASM